MANYLCEEKSSCSNYQSAICLHCNLRLCLSHIAEHNKLIFHDVESLSTELDTTYQQIKEISDKSKSMFSNAISALNDWRTEQTNRVEEIYKNQLQTVTSQQQTSEQFCEQLQQRLDKDARQQLYEMRSQQNISIGVIHFIRQIIEDVQNESKKLTDVFSTIPKINLEQTQQSTTIVKTNKSSSNTPITKACRPFHRLVQIFSHLSSIKQTRKDIDTYIRNQGRYFRLPMLVISYLDAWHMKSNLDEKILLLQEHILTIKKYLPIRKTNSDVLYGIQGFFHYIKVTPSKQSSKSIFVKNQQNEAPAEEMMTFLLQFFLNHQCIDENYILDWYHGKHTNPYKGFIFAKQLATSFIRSITPEQTVRTVSIDPMDVQRIEIKVGMGISE